MGKRRWKRRYNAAGVAIIGLTRGRRRPAASSVWSRRARALVYLLTAVLALGGAWLALDGRFYIERAEVRGTVRLSPDEVFRASGLPGLHILWARSGSVERRLLEALPTLEQAEVRCRLPANCVITVVERQPRMLWDEDGRRWWIDADGMVFSLTPEEQEGGLGAGWTVRGPLPREGEDDRLAEPVRVALNGLWEAGQGVVTGTLDYVPGQGLTFVEEHGWRVVLGEGPGMAERLEVLTRLDAFFVTQAITPTVVDVRFPDAPYYAE